MRIDQSGAEELLRTTLREKAQEAGSALTLDDVRRDAARRGTRWGRRTVAVAAVAALVVGVPAVLLGGPDEGGPAPAPTPTVSGVSISPSPSPTEAPTGPSTGPLGALPRGPSPAITYLEDRTVHLATGATATLPGADAVSAFAAYHDGWLVADDESSGVHWYDSTGALRRRGDGLGLFAVSADGTRLAFPMSGKIHIGIAASAGEGEQTVDVSDPRDVWPVGFLGDGALVYNDAGRVATSSPGAVADLDPMVRARAVSVDDLIAGEDKRGRGIVTSKDGETQWTSSTWTVWAFSRDGRYAAATNTPTGGDFSALAILDARTGKPVVRMPLLSNDLHLEGRPVFDADNSVLLAATDGSGRWAGVRLGLDAKVARATNVVPPAPDTRHPRIVFATGP